MAKQTEELGKAVQSAIKTATKEAVGGNPELVGAAKNLNEMLDAAIGMQQTVSISLYRVNSFNGADEFLSTIADMPPQLIKEQGLEALIKEWSGGGKYRGVIRGAGIPDKSFNVVIGGEALPPKPERTNQQGGAGGLGGMPQLNSPLNMGAGNFMAGPGFANYMGLGGGYGGRGGGNSNDTVVQMLLATVMAQKNSGGDSELIQLEKEKNRQMEMQLVEERRKADQAQSDARHREEMAEIRRSMEELAKANNQPKEDTTVAMMKAVAPMAAMALPLLMDSKTKSAMAQSDMIKNMLGVQKESSDKSLGMMKIMMEQPTVEDRQAKQAETMTNMMGSTMQLMGSMISQMASMQGDGGPPWLQLAREVVGGFTEVGSQMFAGGPPTPQQTTLQGQAEVEGEGTPQLDAAQAAQQARAAMEANAGGGNGDGREVDADGNMSGLEVPVRASYHPGLVKIFDMIESDGNPHEIAFRIWKDGTSGDVTSLAWFRDPEPFTFELLGAFVDSGQMSITEERAKEIADALQEYHDHLKSKLTPEDYLKKYDIRMAMPKKIMVDPIGVSLDGKDQPLMGEPTRDGAIIAIEEIEAKESAPLPKGPQNVEPPVPPAEQEVVVVEGPQTAPPPSVKAEEAEAAQVNLTDGAPVK